MKYYIRSFVFQSFVTFFIAFIRCILPLFISIAFVFTLSGCSFLTGKNGLFGSKEGEYINANSIGLLKEAERNNPVFESEFVIPALNPLDEFGDPVTLEGDDVPRPKPLANEEDVVPAKIQKLGKKRWLYLNASSAQVWPQVQSFLSENGVALSTSNAEKGLIESDWLAFKDDQENKSKFRVMIEKGLHDETSEVHVKQIHIPREATLPADYQWPEYSDSADRAKWFLDEMAAVLAGGVNNNAASLMGQNVGGPVKVQFKKVNDEPALVFDVTYLRAWASMAYALNNGELDLWEDESSTGMFYFGYQKDGPKKTGFWFWKKTHTLPEKPDIALNQRLAELSDSTSVRNAFSHVEGLAFSLSESDLADKKNISFVDRWSYLGVVTKKQFEGSEKVVLVMKDIHGRALEKPLAKKILRLVRYNLI